MDLGSDFLTNVMLVGTHQNLEMNVDPDRGGVIRVDEGLTCSLLGYLGFELWFRMTDNSSNEKGGSNRELPFDTGKEKL